MPRRVDLAKNVTSLPQASLVVIGNFDGVHHGHRAVLEYAVKEAHARKLGPLVLTFDPHPAVVLRNAVPSVLTTMPRRIELLRRVAAELSVVVEAFTQELSRKTARQFVAELLLAELKAQHIVVGENFRFGHGREGDVVMLQELGKELGFSAHAHALQSDAEGAFSSSRVRSAIASGDLAEVERCLGRPHAISGRVIEGDRRGRSIGFPTANLGDVPELLPPNGVYACLVDEIDASGKARALARAVANFGVRPTVGAGPSVEAHLLDFDRDLYGHALRVHLVARLRDEQKFSGLDALVAQIGRDADRAREILAPFTPNPELGGAWY